LGEIVFWTLLRAAVTIPAVWLLRGYFDFQLWWMISLMAMYGIIIHPAVIHYKLFQERNKDIIENTLCSNCKHFDKTAVLCMKHDKHPTKTELPCEGLDWEPDSNGVNNKDIYNT